MSLAGCETVAQIIPRPSPHTFAAQEVQREVDHDPRDPGPERTIWLVVRQTTENVVERPGPQQVHGNGRESGTDLIDNRGEDDPVFRAQGLTVV
jgi:hypothetical protein